MVRLVALGMIFLLAFTVISTLNIKASSQYTSPRAPSGINRLTQTALNETDLQKYHTSDEVISILQALQSAFPTLMNACVIGHSYEDKEIWAAEITNFQTGPLSTKPAMLYVGPHHGNEMIGKEISLYYIWYLLTSYGVNQTITQLLDEKTVYVIPCVNVDGNDWMIRGLPQRYNSRPMDDDGDGLFDEDPPEDLNGDGKILDMRFWNETKQAYDYYPEGFDKDGDGYCTNEGFPKLDSIGGVDLNRNYAKGWENWTNGGEYPFSEPETRTLRDFVTSHPNIATVFDTHSGAMCILYPGTLLPDNQLYTTLKTKYEKLTGYKYHRIGAQGTSIDWIYDNQSAICFCMELFGQGFYPAGPEQFPKDYPDAEVPWQNFTYPYLGEVQIGGAWVLRYYNPPENEIETFALKILPMLLDLVGITPKLEIAQLKALQEFGAGKKGVFNISAMIANTGFLDTATLQALQTQINRPVNVTLSFSGNVELVSGNQTVSFPVIKGNQTVNTQWQIRLAQGSDAWVGVTATSAKGGIDTARVAFNLSALAHIFIKEDGTIDPSSAPIANKDNAVYTFTDDITSASIIVERSNITINGNGHILEGPFNSSEWSVGINLTQNNLNNVTIKNFNIIGFSDGIDMHQGKNIIIYANNITENALNAIDLQETSNSAIYGNTIKDNYAGIAIFSSSNNTIYHNNFMNNTYPVALNSGHDTQNNWDKNSEGNHWSNYTCIDSNHDGISDSPLIIDAGNTDNYPLMGPLRTFNIGTWNGKQYYVDIVSNSTLSDFAFNPPSLRFNVTGTNGTNDFCRVAIPKALMWCDNDDFWTVTVGGELLQRNVTKNAEYTYICFTYHHSTLTVQITSQHAVPEFQSLVFLPLFTIIALLAVMVFKRKRNART